MGSHRSLLLTGATGFVGGSVLHAFLGSQVEAIKSLRLTVLVRNNHQAQVLSDKGIASTVLEGGLDDTEGLSKLASEHDIVVHGATGFHKPSALALIQGLSKRKQERADDISPVYIHLSGTTNLSVGDASGRGGKLQTFSDKKGGIYEYEVEREKELSYTQRSTDVEVVRAGERLGVKTFTIMPPPVIGRGTGFFKTRSQQIPMLINNALQQGQAEYIEPGTSALGYVHVTDLATLFEAVVNQVILEPSLPSGKQGYFFASAGHLEWREIAGAIAKVGHRLGLLKNDQAVPVDLSTAAVKFWEGDEIHTERLLASSSNTVSERGYDIGWKPKVPPMDWEAYIEDELQAIQTTKKGH
ncbi:unnamed protein product [Clonostachys rosea f. rosea IK726]|uniref:Uncharacterized protein n=1 Tax=Clonostachys rosea f. rosea IK726 TaxID=1349383 RepID=A0ACA9UWN1_BIOOC|nr:unnamed protein product [Clonostachys rosea f. rosea IK726]